MSSYILRDAPKDLWERVKARAKEDGFPLRTVILKILAMYAAGELVIKADHRGS